MVTSASVATAQIADCGDGAQAVQLAVTSSKRCSLPVLHCADRTYTIGDVLAFKHWRQSLDDCALGADHKTASKLVETADDDALESALADFRYARDLVSAAECDAWLALRGLRYADLVESLRRPEAAAASIDERECDYLLSADFAEDSRLLARLLCSAIASGLALPRRAEPIEPYFATCASAYTQQCAAALQTGARNSRLRVLQRGLSEIEFDCAEFDSLDAALEARLSVQHDGLSLAELADGNGFVCTRTRQRRSSIASEWQIALDGATAGRLAAPIKDPPRFLVLQPQRAIVAQLSDPEVANRIDSTLLNEYFEPLLTRQVRWELSLDLAGA